MKISLIVLTFGLVLAASTLGSADTESPSAEIPKPVQDAVHMVNDIMNYVMRAQLASKENFAKALAQLKKDVRAIAGDTKEKLDASIEKVHQMMETVKVKGETLFERLMNTPRAQIAMIYYKKVLAMLDELKKDIESESVLHGKANFFQLPQFGNLDKKAADFYEQVVKMVTNIIQMIVKAEANVHENYRERMDRLKKDIRGIIGDNTEKLEQAIDNVDQLIEKMRLDGKSLFEKVMQGPAVHLLTTYAQKVKTILEEIKNDIFNRSAVESTLDQLEKKESTDGIPQDFADTFPMVTYVIKSLIKAESSVHESFENSREKVKKDIELMSGNSVEKVEELLEKVDKLIESLRTEGQSLWGKIFEGPIAKLITKYAEKVRDLLEEVKNDINARS